MNNYVLTVVFDGKATAAKKKTLTTKVTDLIGGFEGTITDTKEWGKMDLAYPIRKATEGVYLTYHLQLMPDTLGKLNEKMRVDDEILRFLVIKSKDSKQAKPVAKKKGKTSGKKSK